MRLIEKCAMMFINDRAYDVRTGEKSVRLNIGQIFVTSWMLYRLDGGLIRLGLASSQ